MAGQNDVMVGSDIKKELDYLDIIKGLSISECQELVNEHPMAQGIILEAVNRK